MTTSTQVLPLKKCKVVLLHDASEVVTRRSGNMQYHKLKLPVQMGSENVTGKFDISNQISLMTTVSGALSSQ